MSDPYQYAPQLADLARQAAAQRMQRSVGPSPTQPQQVPHDFQTWGNLAEATAQNYPPLASGDTIENYIRNAQQQAMDPNYIRQVIGVMPSFGGTLRSATQTPMLSRAERMFQSGASDPEIWDETQHWLTPWGALKEIPDYGARIDPAWQQMAGRQVPLSQVLHHSELYNQFPASRWMGFEYSPTRPGVAQYDPNTSIIHFNQKSTLHDPWANMFHEVQHGVAHEEIPRRLPLGSSPEEQTRIFLQRQGPTWEHYQQLKRLGLPEHEDLILQMAAKRRGYFMDPGEKLSRLNEIRSRMSPEELRIESPDQTLGNMLHREGLNRFERYLQREYGVDPTPKGIQY